MLVIKHYKAYELNNSKNIVHKFNIDLFNLKYCELLNIFNMSFEL